MDADEPSMEHREQLESLESQFQTILIIIIIAFISIAIIGAVDARCIRINDFYRMGAIFTAFIQLLDMLSDCFLAIDISIQNKIHMGEYSILLIICISCIVIPSLLSLCQLVYYSFNIWKYDPKVNGWLLKYSRLLLCLSLFTGSSFTAVEIMNSNIMSLRCFEMGLSRSQVISYKCNRIYSVVFLENIPQLALQVLYMIKLKDTSNIIAISSAILSAISIIVTVVSLRMEKSLINSRDCTLIKIDVVSKQVVMHCNQCKKRVRRIKAAISMVVGVDDGLIEMMKPQSIPNGLRLEAYLYVTDTEHNQNDYYQLLEAAWKNGSLPQSLFDAWNLPNVPAITQIECVKIGSPTAVLKMRSVEKQMTATIKDHQDKKETDVPPIEHAHIKTRVASMSWAV